MATTEQKKSQKTEQKTTQKALPLEFDPSLVYFTQQGNFVWTQGLGTISLPP